MSWEIFTGWRKTWAKPMISVYARSMIVINFAAINTYKLHDFQYIELWYDRMSEHFAVKFLMGKKENAAKLTRLGKSKYYQFSFSVRSNFKEMFQPGRYKVFWNKEKQWLEAYGRIGETK